MNITELFESLKTYIRSVIQDKITIIEAKRVQAEGSANSAATSASAAATSASDAADSANNAAGAASTAVQTKIDELVGQAPETLDTLEEFAEALGNNPNFATTTAAQIGERAKTVDVNAALAEKADKTELTAGLNTKANSSHTHPVTQIDAGGTRGSSTYLRGDGQWATPPDTTYPYMSAAYYQAGTDTANRTIRAVDLKAAIQYHGVAQASPGAGLTLWTGNQAAYDALPAATKNAAGFIAVIT